MNHVQYHLSAADPVVGDHRIGGIPVLPAAAQLDLMLTACDATRPGRQWQLDRVTFLAPLRVPGARIEIGTAVAENGECTVSSRPPGQTDGADGTWSTHSRAQATGSALPPPHYLDVARLRAGCVDEVPLAEMAEWRRTSGIDYGPTYQAIRSLHRGPGRMLAVLRVAEDLAGGHLVPPALLDSVFQCLGALDDGAAGVCLPWYVGRLVARRAITGTVLALIEQLGVGDGPDAEGTAGVVRGRATLCNQQGEVLLELDRIVLKGPATADRAQPGRAPRRRDPATAPVTDPGPATASGPVAESTPPLPAPGAITTPTWRIAVPTPEPAPTEGTTLVVAREAVEWCDRQVRITPEDLFGEHVDAALGDITPREVVYVAPRGLSGAEAAAAVLHGVFTLVRRLAARPPMADLTIVTTAAQSVTGREDIEPSQAALWGLARTLRIEYPRTRVRLVDLEISGDGPPAPPAGWPYAQPELAWRDGTWYEPSLAPVAVDQPAVVPIAGGRFLITGGMGGIGLHVAEFLARQGCAHLTLVGRTVPEQGEARERLDRLAATCEVVVVQGDVRCLPEALAGAAPFDGVFHAAGVLRDGLLRSLSPEQVDEVFNPKIRGVHALDEAFPRQSRPRFVALFSSISAVHGNLGQAAYGTANAYLDGYAAHRRAQGESWYSLGWGLWTVGMGEGIVRGAAARGIPALTVDEGVDLLQATLHLPPSHYVLSATSTPKDEQMTVVAAEARLWPSLAAILKKILHVNDVALDDNLLELGLDSMMAVEVAAALATEGLDIDPVTFFEHANVDALLTHLESMPRSMPAGTTAGTATAAAVTNPAPARVSVPSHAPAPAPARTPAPEPRSAAVRETRASAGPAPALANAAWDQFREVDASAGHEWRGEPAVPAVPPTRRVAPRSTAPSAAGPRRAPVPAVEPRGPVRTPARSGTGDPTGTPGRLTPRRTLPARLHDLPDGSFLDRRIDVMSAEDRMIIAADDYFYEPVIEDAEGAWIKFDGRWFLNLASYSYLGLIGHDYINDQAQRAVQRYGTGAHGVRLLAGTLQLHRELEQTIARFLGTEDAIVFTSGYMANVATVGSLVGPDDVIIGDVYNHASILDGYRLSGARVITYAHNDLVDLERALRKAGDAGKLVVTDAVFSMDGDIADLPGILELCERYDAALMVDEAHSLGVLGATGRGITEHFGIDSARVAVKMGTLSKTVPSAGGYVAGSSDLIFALKNNARGWMFSAAGTPAQVAAAKAAFEVMAAGSGFPGELRALTTGYRENLHRLGFDTRESETPVVPIYCDNSEQALMMARLCQRDGLFVQPIVYPTVPRALPRLRTIVNRSHSQDDLDEAVAILEKAGRQVGLID